MRDLRGLLAPALALSMAAALAACGSGGSSGAGGKTKLIIATFGDFGYQDLYKEYEKLHTDIQITERVTKAEDHHKNIAAHVATDLGAADLKSQWPDWKWQSSVAKNGAQLGIGTDVGGLAMCYRNDLFAKAGLPTDRDAVSALWSTWDGYIETGKKFAAAKVPGSAFFDGPTVMYRAVLGQADVGLYDSSDNVVVETNPAVRAAFNKTIEALGAGLSAKIEAFSPEWNAGFQKGGFATVACPSWMMAYIQDQAKDSAGKWDVAKIPGGSGNWGGSFLTLPKQGKNSK